MIFIAFLLGLAVGIGFCLRQQSRLNRQMLSILSLLPTVADSVSLPLITRLHQGIALANQHQQDLEIQLQTWQQLLWGAPVGYLQIDEENQLIWCNKQARSLLQIHRWEPGQVRLLVELVRSYELDQLIEQTREQQQPESKEWVFHPPTCPDLAAMSEVRSLTLQAYSWPLLQGQVGVFLENRQPLVELFESQERWISDLAHELRTPLTSISLVAETLQKRLDPPLRRWVDQMLQETNRLINLVKDCLELTQLQGDLSKHLTAQPLELRSLINSVWHTLEPLARQKRLSLNYFGLDSVWFKADKARLIQVFLNLLHNSIKYSPFEESIRVEVNILPIADAPQFIEINIIDSGTGFPESDLPHVFERLYRGDPSRVRQPTSPGVGEEINLRLAGVSDSVPLRDLESKSASKQLANSLDQGEFPVTDVAYNFSSNGSGLGLAIVRQIIVAHGGSVIAKNHPETGGGWLQVQLPLI